jgi:two-component system aerobic respiration control protein ArcA
MKKKIDTKDLVDKIAKLARSRMTDGPVVSLEQIKDHNQKKPKRTLLVIEDDDTLRRALQRIFEAEGYRVIAACDGTELVDVFVGSAVDLIMLDVGLPWVNGYELAKMMKEHSGLSHVPIVFISGFNDQEAMKKGFGAGAHDYITKPFDIEKVKKTVDTLMKLHHD